MNSPGPVHGLTAENILAAFPIALQGDHAATALAEVTARLLTRRPEEVDRLLIYPAIDRLDEKLLDILAYDFKVDWYDPNYSLEEKRRTLKDSWRVHKLLGTRAAVEAAISAVYQNSEVQEWFEYGGEPYHFHLRINISNDTVDSERMRRVLARLNFYKSLRSHNDGIHYFMEPEAMTSYVWMGCPGLHGTLETAVNVPELTPPGGDAQVKASIGTAGQNARMPAKVDMSAEVPCSGIKTGAGAVESGENTIMAASLELHTEVTGGMGSAQAGAAEAGMRAYMARELDLRREWPGLAAYTGAPAGACGWSMGTEVVLDLRKTAYPDGISAARAVGKTAGMYQKFVMEVSANETLE